MISDHRNRLALNVEALGAILKQLGLFWSDRSDRSGQLVRPVPPKIDPMAPIQSSSENMIMNKISRRYRSILAKDVSNILSKIMT